MNGDPKPSQCHGQPHKLATQPPGRTGMVATMLLLRKGLPLDEAISIIRLAGSVPDTLDQRIPFNAASAIATKHYDTGRFDRISNTPVKTTRL